MKTKVIIASLGMFLVVLVLFSVILSCFGGSEEGRLLFVHVVSGSKDRVHLI